MTNYLVDPQHRLGTAKDEEDEGYVLRGSGVTIGSGDTMLVADGTASNNKVTGGGVTSGSNQGFGIGPVDGVGYQDVSAGASATNTTIDGGYQDVYGNAAHTNVGRGYQEVEDGATATDTVVVLNGHQRVDSGGSVSDTDVQSGGEVFFYGNADISSVKVESGGTIGFWTGNTQNGYDVADGVIAYVRDGGTFKGTHVQSGGESDIYQGSTATGDIVDSGGEENVYHDASITGSILSGGHEIVHSGGTATGTQIYDGGKQSVHGLAVNTVIHSGGVQEVKAGSGTYDHAGAAQTAQGSIVNSGGTQNIYDSSFAYSTMINGGSETVFSGGTTSGVTIQGGGTETVGSGGTVIDPTLTAGLLDLQSGGTASGTITLGGDAILRIEQPIPDGLQTSATIAGFAPGDQIDLSNVAFDPSGATVFTRANQLVLEEGGHDYTLQLSSSFSPNNGSFKIHSDGTSGTYIEYQNKPALGAITNQDTDASDYSVQASPYNAVVSIVNSKGRIGTGFVIDDHFIVTDAHVVDPVNGIDPDIQVTLTNSGHQTTIPVLPDEVLTGLGYKPGLSGDDPNYLSNELSDYAVIYSPEDLLQATGGVHFDLDSSNFNGSNVNITGYGNPAQGDNGTEPIYSSIQEQYNVIGSVSQDKTIAGFYDEVGQLSYHGDSGGPLWTSDGTTYLAEGLVTTSLPGDESEGLDLKSSYIASNVDLLEHDLLEVNDASDHSKVSSASTPSISSGSSSPSGVTPTSTPSISSGSSSPSGVTPTSVPSSHPTIAVSFAPTVTYTAKGGFVLTGTASSAARGTGVEISAAVDGVETDLGTATVNADGTFDFSDIVGAHTQAFINATVTDAAGATASSTAAYALTGALGGALGGASKAEQDIYSADGGAVLTRTRFAANGVGVADVEAPGQTVDLQPFETVANHGRAGTAFVFDVENGIDVIRGFKFEGTGHDVLQLPSSDFNSVADVLRNTGDVGGSAFVTDPVTGDAIRLAGVTTAELKAHPKDFVFSA